MSEQQQAISATNYSSPFKQDSALYLLKNNKFATPFFSLSHIVEFLKSFRMTCSEDPVTGRSGPHGVLVRVHKEVF